MKFNITKEVKQQSKIPHDIFLTNLVANHLLFFIALLEITVDFPLLPVLSPILSLFVLVYIIIKGGRMTHTAPWFIAVHWRIAIARCRLLMWLLIIMLIISTVAWTLYKILDLDMITVFPFAALSAIPALVAIVLLVIMESDALHLSTQGKINDGMILKFPPPEDSEHWQVVQPLLEKERLRKELLEKEKLEQEKLEQQ